MSTVLSVSMSDRVKGHDILRLPLSSKLPVLSSGRKSFSNKLSGLLTSKPSHITDYYIELDEAHRQYSPGDRVKGQVVLKVARPLGVTHIVVCLYGYIEVFKNDSTPKSRVRNSGTHVATGRGRRWVSEYYGDGFASLFEDEIVLCGEGRLDPQQYNFQFEVDFPSSLSLPSSIDVRWWTET